MMRLPSSRTFGVLVVMMAVLGVALAQLDNACGDHRACRPWEVLGRSCSRGGRMDLRFALDVEGSTGTANVIVNGSRHYHATYAYCPVVDQLQAFSLNLTMTDSGAAPRIKIFNQSTYLRVFGMGSITENFPPNGFDSAAVVFDQVPQCGGHEANATGFAVASFLVLNITMTNGRYRHLVGSDQGIQVGFMPTCEGDRCIFGDGVCVGKPGKKNCAKCINAYPEDVLGARINVWASYYGTDASGRRFMSGSDNPLNFREMATTGSYDSISDKISDSITGL